MAVVPHSVRQLPSTAVASPLEQEATTEKWYKVLAVRPLMVMVVSVAYSTVVSPVPVQ
jgi:hypothetical protein